MFIFVAIILTSLKFSIAYEICAAATCATGKNFYREKMSRIIN